MQHSAEEQGLAALALQTLLAVIIRLIQHTLLAYFVMHVAAVLQAALGDSWLHDEMPQRPTTAHC